jgi:endonuclease/exonuclease/phosphatase (EEP) superfamily protein YafD
VLDHVQGADADLVLLIEVDSAWLKAMEPLAAEYPHHIAHPRGDNFGIALFSRTALNDPAMLALPEAGLPSIMARITHQGRNIVVIGTHPPPPAGARFAGLQQRKLRLLAETVAATEDPVLLVGDLNATPWSQGMRILTAGKLGFRSLEPPWVPTWSVNSPFAIPIDHVLATSPLVITRRSIGPDLGTDHRSIDFTVSWAQ